MKGFEVVAKDAARTTPRERLFTLPEAMRALPLVRRVVTDFVEQYRELEKMAQRRRTLPVIRRGAIRTLDKRAAEAGDRLRDLLAELAKIGCVIKDWEQGLIDFRCRHEDREVYLCWRLGEDTIAHWHELHEGALFRKTVDERFQAMPSRSATAELDMSLEG
jgi:hypothetical protein